MDLDSHELLWIREYRQKCEQLRTAAAAADMAAVAASKVWGEEEEKEVDHGEQALKAANRALRDACEAMGAEPFAEDSKEELLAHMRARAPGPAVDEENERFWEEYERREEKALELYFAGAEASEDVFEVQCYQDARFRGLQFPFYMEEWHTDGSGEIVVPQGGESHDGQEDADTLIITVRRLPVENSLPPYP